MLNSKNNNRNIKSGNFGKKSINDNCTTTNPATRPRPKPPGSSSRENK